MWLVDSITIYLVREERGSTLIDKKTQEQMNVLGFAR